MWLVEHEISWLQWAQESDRRQAPFTARAAAFQPREP